MKGSNITILGVAAVIVVLCLVFSFLYLDEGDPAEREEMQVGDYRIYACITEDSDGDRSQYTLTQTVVGTDGDGYVLEEDRETTVSTLHVGHGYLYPELPEDCLSAEDAPVDVPLLGERVCDVYTVADGDDLTVYCVDVGSGKAVYIIETVSGTYRESVTEYILIADSMSMPAREYGSCTHIDGLITGDYVLYMGSNDVISAFPIVLSVEVDNGDGTITYHNDYTGEFGVCTPDEFFAGAMQGDYVSDGSYQVGTPYGDRLCEKRVYASDGGYTYAYVASDGICYMLETADGNGDVTGSATIVFSNCISGDLELVGQDDLSAGDERTYVEIYSDPEGGVSYSVRTDRVVSVFGDSITYESFIDGVSLGMQTGSYVTEPVGDWIGSTALRTAYGEIYTAIWMSEADGVTTYMYVHDGIVIYEREIAEVGDGMTFSTERMLVRDTSIDGISPYEGRINLGYVEEGSWLDYNVYLDGEHVSSVSCDVVSVDGDDVMVSVDGGEPFGTTASALLNGYPEGSDIVLAGQYLMETVWGYVVCDVYGLEAEFQTYYYIGADDGICYMTEYLVGDGVYTVYLEGSSTAF